MSGAAAAAAARFYPKLATNITIFIDPRKTHGPLPCPRPSPGRSGPRQTRTYNSYNSYDSYNTYFSYNSYLGHLGYLKVPASPVTKKSPPEVGGLFVGGLSGGYCTDTV